MWDVGKCCVVSSHKCVQYTAADCDDVKHMEIQSE
ncbi:hypothetical protein BVRB_5g118990 [Beta vulgaris subsp. vulgaris]|nr:hypothetical protein BVRB_5g118990 [Beta vulgaris subsp. vulgaris]